MEGLKAHNPDLVAAIAGESHNADALAKAVDAARNEERTRVTEIIKSGASSDLVLKAVEDGEPAHGIYKQMVEAMQSGKESGLADMEGSLGSGVDAKGESKKQDDAGRGKQPEFMALVDEHMKTSSAGRGDAIIAMARKYPDAHAAWKNNR